MIDTIRKIELAGLAAIFAVAVSIVHLVYIGNMREAEFNRNFEQRQAEETERRRQFDIKMEQNHANLMLNLSKLSKPQHEKYVRLSR